MSIDAYINSKKLAWSQATITSERSRLKTHAKALESDDASAVYQQLLDNGYKPYTIKTMFVRFSAYLQWSKKNDIFGAFLEQNSRLFKSAYVKDKVPVTYGDVIKYIDSIQDGTVREHLRFLIRSGVRISESYSTGDMVIGKGNKTRKVFVAAPTLRASKTALKRALAPLGISPHDLRKLCATRLVERGASPQDLCYVMGWSDIKTAYNYLQPKKDEEIARMLE